MITPNKQTSQKKIQGIDYFGRGHWLSQIQANLSLGARRKMFQCWKEYANPKAGDSLLDIGSTPDLERLDSNCMIPWFEEIGIGVSLYSPEDISNLGEVFPKAKILPSKGFGNPIPAAPRSFNWVASSAVLEHVGSQQKQIDFIRECASLGDGIFLTTPNRSHWLEFHTKIPLLHWLPRSIHRAILKAIGKPFWAEEQNLRLLCKSELKKLAEVALTNEFDYRVEHVWALGMPSNLVLLAKRKR